MSLTPGQRREVQAMIAQYGSNKRGIIVSYQPSPPMVKCQIMPAPAPPDVPTETGWIPYKSFATGLEGSGWAVVAPPQAGQQVLLICEEGDGQNFTAWGGYYSHVDGAPQGAAPGEILFQHQSGSQVWLKSDGSINQTAPIGVNTTTPNAVFSGNVNVGSGVTGTFSSTEGYSITVQDGIVIGITE